MSRVLIGIGAAVVLAGAIFAIVHFSSTPKQVSLSSQQGGLATQDGWTPIVAPLPLQSPVKVVGTFGAWRILCRDAKSSRDPENAPTNPRANAHANPAGGSPTRVSSPCAVVLILRHLGARKEMLSLRLTSFGFGKGMSASFAMLAYSTPASTGSYSAPQHSAGKEVQLVVDKHPLTLNVRRCNKIGCFATSQLAKPDLDSFMAARRMAIQLDPSRPAGAGEVQLPTKGLKEALTALQRRQPTQEPQIGGQPPG